MPLNIQIANKICPDLGNKRYLLRSGEKTFPKCAQKSAP
jgi:hypothetical protein